MDTTSRTRELIVPLVEAAGADLYDLEYTGGTLRVTITHQDGVDVELITKVTRSISHALDEEDPIAGQYTLEVSSPGLERNLRRPEHFQGAVGSLVALKLRAGVEGDRRIKGTLTGFDGSVLSVTTDSSNEPRTVVLEDIERARTVFEWGPAPKPSTRSTSPSAQKKKAARS
ncbi:MAG: ribosome maturation factor RimP [Acidimicrobiales bacterium]|nr:ribosome maturation factor RimP [Acidimicrobiales bacterium]